MLWRETPTLANELRQMGKQAGIAPGPLGGSFREEPWPRDAIGYRKPTPGLSGVFLGSEGRSSSKWMRRWSALDHLSSARRPASVIRMRATLIFR
jgi:hypothetical protein